MRITRCLLGLALVAAAPAAALAWPAEATRELAVREGPGMEHPHIEVIPPGTLVEVHRCRGESSWCRVSVGGTTGYLRREFLEPLAETAPPPPAPGVEVHIGVGPRPYGWGPYGPPYRRHYYGRPY